MKRAKIDNLLFILILIFTSYFLVKNIDKLEYTYKKTFETPIMPNGQLAETAVLQVRVHYDGKEYRESFIKHAIQDEDGNNIVFMSVPIEVNFDSSEVWFGDNRVHDIKRNSQHVLQATRDNTIVYIINRDHAEHTISILSGVDYTITSEFPY